MFADSTAVGVSLAELFPRSRFHRAHDIRVTSCCASPESCRPGDLYVAVVETDRDGHFFAERAIERGASAILTERLLPVAVPQCIVDNSSLAIAQLCQRLAGNPAQRLEIAGVAGNYGTTATQMMLCSVLEAGGSQPAVHGQLGHTDGFQAFPSAGQDTTASSFARWLADVAANGCTHAITQMQRQSVSRHTHAGVPIRWLLLGALGTSTHRRSATPKTESYLRRLQGQLRCDSHVVANIDCPIVREFVADMQHPVTTISTEFDADITARRLEQIPSEQTFLLQADEQTSVIRSKIIGDTHLQSCLIAVAAGLQAGIDLATAVRAVESIASIPGHLERVECGQPFSVFSDASQSASHFRDTLLTLREVTEGRLICVFGQGQSRRPELRAQRGQVAEKYSDLGVITSDDINETEPLRVVHDVLDGYRKPAHAHVLPNRTRAIEWALEQAQPGDTVLLAGPHNQLVARSDDDFPADTEVARFHLFETKHRKHKHLIPSLEAGFPRLWNPDGDECWN